MILQTKLKSSSHVKIIKENKKNENQYFKWSFILIVTGLVTGLSIAYSLYEVLLNHCTENQKIYWTIPRVSDPHNLDEVNYVLNNLGYINRNNINCKNNSNWDLLWTWYHAFKAPEFKPHQKINHIPGNYYLISKKYLSTSGFEYIPPSFRLPEDKEKLLEYSKKNLNALFLSKHKDHRNVKLVNLTEIDYNNKNYFIQVFLGNTLLIDGFKFDIGLYTLVTSIDPLRIYVYNSDIALRFCPEKYHPFDPKNVNKYVIGQKYLPAWKVPVLDQYLNKLGYTYKETLNAYLQDHGIDTKKIYQQAEYAIQKYALSVENKIMEKLKEYPSKRNFFELIRCDFLVDEHINVHLLECNMSPNLSSLEHPINSVFFQQIIYNVFKILGIADNLDRDAMLEKFQLGEHLLATDKDLVISPHNCISPECQSSCKLLKCQLCKHCLTDETKEFLRDACEEHIRRGDFNRIFPPKMTQADTNDLTNLTLNNQLQYLWFQGKCEMDSTWC